MGKEGKLMGKTCLLENGKMEKYKALERFIIVIIYNMKASSEMETNQVKEKSTFLMEIIIKAII